MTPKEISELAREMIQLGRELERENEVGFDLPTPTESRIKGNDESVIVYVIVSYPQSGGHKVSLYTDFSNQSPEEILKSHKKLECPTTKVEVYQLPKSPLCVTHD